MGGCCSNPKYSCEIRCCCCCRTRPWQIGCCKCCLPSGPYSALRCDLCSYGPAFIDEEIQFVSESSEKSVPKVTVSRDGSTGSNAEVIMIEPTENIRSVSPKKQSLPPMKVDAECNTDPEPLSMASFTKDSTCETNPVDLIDGYSNQSDDLTLKEVLEGFDDQITDLSEKINEALKKCNFPNELGLTQDQSAAIYIRSMHWPGKTLNDLLEETWKSAKDPSTMKCWFPYLKLLISALEKFPDVEGEVWQGIEFDTKCAEKLKKKPPKLFTSLGLGASSIGAIKRHLRKNDKTKRIILIGYKGVAVKDITEYIENSDQPTTCLLPGLKIDAIQIPDEKQEKQGVCIFHLSCKSRPQSPSESFPLPILKEETHFSCPNKSCINNCDGKHEKNHCRGFAHLNHSCGHHCGQGYRCYRCKKHNEKLHQCSSCHWRFCKECCFHDIKLMNE